MKLPILISTVAIASCLGCSGEFSQKVTIPQPAVQSAVDAWMPINLTDYVDKELPIIVTLDKAEVLMGDGTDRMGLKLNLTTLLQKIDVAEIRSKTEGELKKKLPAGLLLPPPPGLSPQSIPETEISDQDSADDVEVASKKVEGQVVARVGLRFDGKTSSFYCKDATVESVEFEDLPAASDDLLRRVCETALNKYFEANSVYTLSGDDAAMELVKSGLKDVTIKDGQLVVEIGF